MNAGSAPGVEAGVGARVLIVEDDPDVRRLLARVLARGGYQTSEAGCGEEGVRVFEREHPDVVVLDLRLGAMSGFDCFRAMRSTDVDFAAILLTAQLTRETAVEAANHGFHQILLKPLEDSGELVRAVERAAETVRLRRENHELAVHLLEQNRLLEASNQTLRGTVAELARARRRADAILQTVPFPIVLLSPRREILGYNESYRRTFGPPASEAELDALPAQFLSARDLEEIEGGLAGQDTVYLVNRVWNGPGGQGIFDVLARRVPLGDGAEPALLLCMQDRTASRTLQRRFDRRRRLSAVGAVAAGLAEDLLDPVTLIRINLTQLGDRLALVRRVWDEVARRFRPVDRTQAALMADAEEALADAREMLDESRDGLGRMLRVLRVLPQFLDEAEAELGPERLELPNIVERALTMTRGQLRPRCEVRVSFSPMAQVRARAVDLVQAFVELLLAAGDCLRTWGVVHVEGAVSGEAACVRIRMEDDDPRPLTRAAVSDIDLTDAIEMLHRHGGSLDVECEDAGGLAFVVRLPTCVAEDAN
jgi:DNA-binding response OmpR family regulator